MDTNTQAHRITDLTPNLGGPRLDAQVAFLPRPSVAYQPPPQIPMPAPGYPIPTVMTAPNGQVYYGYQPVPYQPPAPPDPRPKLMAGAGVLAAGAGWGGAQLLTAMAGVSIGTVVAVAVAAVALKVQVPGGGRAVHNTTENHHHHSTVATGFFGRAISNSTANSTNG